MKICSNCNSSGFDRYRLHEKEPELRTEDRQVPVPPILLYRCISPECGLCYNPQEYAALEDLSPSHAPK
jgi:hypothetical protein